MNNFELEQLLNEKLAIHQISDYAPNGLQVEGKAEVKKIITGVTASLALIDYAIEQQADAILVHHGYFWKSEDPCLRGMKGNRIKKLMQNDINLYAYHLPLDLHPELGNNALLAEILGIKNLQPMEKEPSIPVWGELKEPTTVAAFSQKINTTLLRQPLVSDATEFNPQAPKLIQKIGLCTGAAQDYLTLAAQLGLDAFISGEISERTIHESRELGIHYFACGHHATERYGIQALGQWLTQAQGLEVIFKDIDNPV